MSSLPDRLNLDALAARAFVPVEQAVARGNIPGAVLGLVDAGGQRAIRVAGSAQVVPEHHAMTSGTWFDLASLTKVIFTTTAILRLVEAGRIRLEDRLVEAIPDLRQYDMDALERKLTFAQCLAHQTPLPAVEPLYTYGQDSQTLRAFVLQRVWKIGPPVYSDINFILLGIALERLTGIALLDQPLPAGLTFTPPVHESAATEFCTWRGRMMRGHVHDENAFALGGASGHAGLFGTVDGVLDFARSLLDGSALSPASLNHIRTRFAGTRTIGWQIAHKGWSGGDATPEHVIGHTGFTGTGLWLDFDRGLAWTLLTNRVHPSRHVETGINDLRRNVGDIVSAAA